MRGMGIVAVGLLMGTLVACGGADKAGSAESGSANGTAGLDALRLSPVGDGTWRAEYTFAEETGTLAFARSRGNYRTATWMADAGASLSREGEFDVIRLDPPGRTARFTFTPELEPLPNTYDPALVFSDGGMALFLDQFSLVEVPDGDPGVWSGDLQTNEVERSPLSITFDTASRIVAGDVVEGPLTLVANGEERVPGYVYIGDTPLIEGTSFVGVIDGGLPEWLAERLDGDITQTFTALEARFGEALPTKSPILLSYGGDAIEGLSQSGSVIGDMFVARLEGNMLSRPDGWIGNYLEAFFGHEVTHLFQSRKGQRAYLESWIHEGHASAMAYEIMLGMPDADGEKAEWVAEERDQLKERCREALEGATLQAALEIRNYACGEMVWRALDVDLARTWDALLEEAGEEPLESRHLIAVLPEGQALSLEAALRATGDTALAALGVAVE